MNGVSNYSPSSANCRWFIVTFLAFSQTIAVALPMIVLAFNFGLFHCQWLDQDLPARFHRLSKSSPSIDSKRFSCIRSLFSSHAQLIPFFVNHISGLLDNFFTASPPTVFFGLALRRCNIVNIVNFYHRKGFCTIIAVRDNLLFHQR